MRSGAPTAWALAISLSATCLGTAAQPAAAQNAGAVSAYSLRQTIAAALESSADLRTAARFADIDRKRADEAFAHLRPNTSIQGAVTQFDQKTRVAVDGLGLTLLQDHDEAVSLGIVQDLDLFGQVRTAASEHKLQSLADRMVVASIRNGRILQAKTVFYNLLRAQHSVRVAEAAFATARQQQEVATKLYSNEVGQKIDVLRANTQVAASMQALTRARNALDLARNSFADLVGIPLSSVPQVQDVPGVDAGIQISAGSVGDTPSLRDLFTANVDDVSGADVEQAIDVAKRRRPEVLQAETLQRAAETGVKLARTGIQPTFAISASTSYYPTPTFMYPRQAVSEVTLGVSIPLWDGGVTEARVKEARLQVDNTATMLDRRRKDVALEVRQARLNLLTAAHQLESANMALRQAAATRQLAQARFESQVGLYLEVTDTQAALVEAENAQVNTVYDYLIARAQYEHAIGLPAER